MFVFKQKLLNIRCQIHEIKRFTSDFDTHIKLFQNYFGLNHPKARNYIAEQTLDKFDPKNIMKVVHFCENCGFTKENILKNPAVLRTHPVSVDQHFSVMMEGGFKNITLKSLAKFRTLYRRRIYQLKEVGLIDPQINVADSFIQHLNPRPKDFSVKTNDDSDTWNEIHLKVLIAYLCWRLQASTTDIQRLISIHNKVERKSFRYLCHNIKFAEEIGFSNEKMLKYGYILHAYPKYTKELLEKFPQIVGVDMKRAMRMYPKLITATPEGVERIYSILKANKIPEETMAKRLNVFYLSPETVEFRLSELKRITDFKVLLHNPNILKLIVHHNRAKSRLSFLKTLQLKCATVSVLGADDNKFDNYIKEGKDTNSFSDTYSFIQGTFKKEIHEFKDTLRKHPYYLLVPLTTMQETYNFLKSENYSNSAIYTVIHILLYPKEKVSNSFIQVNQYLKETNSTLTQVNKLNLALYFIEKEHHFTGDGIWDKSEPIEETTVH